jgi:hypothetical protein
MVADTLNYIAKSEQAQQITVLIQGLMLVLGAILSFFKKGGSK